VSGGAIIRSGSETVPGATGPDEVSWARRQIEQELSPSSRADAPCGVVSCHPSAAGRWPCAEASNPVTATTIATLAAIRLRDADGEGASALLLVNPHTDMTLSQPSVDEKGQGWGLDAEEMGWFVEQWVPDPDRRADPQVSPLFADLTGLPPTVVATAEHDPLRDDGEELALRLLSSGVTFEHCRLRGMVHGFMNLDDVSPAAARAGDDVLQRFARLLPRG